MNANHVDVLSFEKVDGVEERSLGHPKFLATTQVVLYILLQRGTRIESEVCSLLYKMEMFCHFIFFFEKLF